MKVLYFMNHAGKGGAALALYDLICVIKQLYGQKYDLVVVTGKYNELNKKLNDIGIENHVAPFNNFLSSYKSPKWIWRSFIILRYWLRRPLAISKIESMIDFGTIDVIHSNLDRIDIGAYFAKKYHLPHIWHIRENARGDFKLMSVYNNPIMHMLQYESTFVTISESVTRNWISFGIPKQSIRLVYDGIRSDCFDSFKVRPIEDKYRFVFLGGYAESKGQFRFIRALANLSIEYKQHLQVDFYGNGDPKYIEAINRFINENQLGDFVNLFNYDTNIYSKLHDYHIGVNCSINEGFGRVTVEYMMAGLCPFVSSSGANQELVEDGKCGIVYDVENEANLVERLIYVLNNPQKIKQLAINARERSFANFSMNKHAERIVELYNELTC